MLPAVSEAGQDVEVRAITGRLDGFLARRRLPAHERLESDEACAGPLELTHGVAERVFGPHGVGGPERRYDPSAFAANEERELQSDTGAPVPRPAVLVGLRSVMPAVLLEQGRDPRTVDEPDRDVDVRMWSRDRPGVEVDRPAAEQPVRDALPLEECVDRG